jgi:hypothetical protein
MFTFNISTLERFSLADGNLLNLCFPTKIFNPPEGRVELINATEYLWL